jgi:hypothetical protein
VSRPAAVASVSPPEVAAPRRRHAPGAAVAAIVLVVVAALGTVWWLAGPLDAAGAEPTLWVLLHDQRDGSVLVSHEVAIGDRLTLEHTHSVTRRPVIETFSVQDGPTIALEELWFDEPGPNLPSGPERIGGTTTTFLHEDGAFRVLHHGHVIGAVPLLVGSASVDHVVSFEDGEQVRLLDVAAPGIPVEVRVSVAEATGR